MPPPIRTRRLLLDAFGTLFSPRLPVHEQYDLVARRMGICVDQLLLKGSFKRSFKEMNTQHPLYGKLSNPSLTPEQWWSSLISQTFLGAGYPSIDLAQQEIQLTSTLLARFQSAEAYALHPDVLPLLHSLPSLDVRPIVVSGSDRGIVHVLRDLDVLGEGEGEGGAGLRQEDVLTTWELEREKKDPAFWEAVLARLNEDEGNEGKDKVRAEECLVVGDELISDYNTPRKVGMRSLLLRRPGAGGKGHARADYADEDGSEKGLEVISSLGEVEGWLKGRRM